MTSLEILIIIIIVVIILAVLAYKYRGSILALLTNKEKNEQYSLISEEQHTSSLPETAFTSDDDDVYNESGYMGAVGANFL